MRAQAGRAATGHGDTFQLGLTGITVEPNTRDVFVTLVGNASAGNGTLTGRIVRLHSNDSGLTAASRSTVLELKGSPMSPSHQISNITIGPDGKLYVHVGDGFVSNTASNLNDFRGKILRINQDGTAPSDNPFYAQRRRDQRQGLRLRLRLSQPLRRAVAAVRTGRTTRSRTARRATTGWRPFSGASTMAGPAPPGARRRRRADHAAIYNWTPTHAPVNIEFVEAGRFGGSRLPHCASGDMPSSPRPGRTMPWDRRRAASASWNSVSRRRISARADRRPSSNIAASAAPPRRLGRGSRRALLHRPLQGSQRLGSDRCRAIIWRVRYTGAASP